MANVIVIIIVFINLWAQLIKLLLGITLRSAYYILVTLDIWV
jgi:hypothetical protein